MVREIFKGDIACLGDFNLDTLKNDKPAEKLMNWAKSTGLTQLITEPQELLSNRICV